MIKGVGIDLVKIERIKRAIDNKKALPQSGKNLVIRASLVEGASEARPHNNGRFLKRVFTKEEITKGEKKKDRYQFYGAHFATKEAVMKALGTGWRKGVRWIDIQIIHNNDGMPEVKLVGKTKEIAKRLGIDEVLVSMSHTKEYAIAQAIAIRKARK